MARLRRSIILYTCYEVAAGAAGAVGAGASSAFAPPSGISSGLSDNGPLVADMPLGSGLGVGVASVAAGFESAAASVDAAAAVVGGDAATPLVAAGSLVVVVAGALAFLCQCLLYIVLTRAAYW